MSLNSPTPKLFSLRKLKTGMAMPAPSMYYWVVQANPIIVELFDGWVCPYHAIPVIPIFITNEFFLTTSYTHIYMRSDDFWKISDNTIKIFCLSPAHNNGSTVDQLPNVSQLPNSTKFVPVQAMVFLLQCMCRCLSTCC